MFSGGVEKEQWHEMGEYGLVLSLGTQHQETLS